MGSPTAGVVRGTTAKFPPRAVAGVCGGCDRAGRFGEMDAWNGIKDTVASVTAGIGGPAAGKVLQRSYRIFSSSLNSLQLRLFVIVLVDRSALVPSTAWYSCSLRGTAR